MADDIVNELREWGGDGDGSEYDIEDAVPCSMLREAADEIERLRADLEEAYDACRYALANSPRWQENCATVIATWEARRG